jgi:hypothetical protein
VRIAALCLPVEPLAANGVRRESVEEMIAVLDRVA